MTGLWAIIGIMVFCLVVGIYSKHYRLPYSQFFYSLPTILALVYFMGAYGWFILNTGHIVPYSIIEMGQIIIPPNFWFHAGSLALGIVMSTLIFIYKLPKNTRKKWIDCLAMWYLLGLTVMGVFLLLGDHMIGLPTISPLGVSAYTHFSEVSKFTRVYPVWLFVSASALLCYLVTILLLKKQVDTWRGFGSFGLLFFLLAIVLMFQLYPRHGVISIGTIRFDINQYILIVLSIICFVGYIYNHKKQHHQSF